MKTYQIKTNKDVFKHLEGQSSLIISKYRHSHNKARKVCLRMTKDNLVTTEDCGSVFIIRKKKNEI